MNEKLIPLYKEVYEKTKQYEEITFPYFEAIDKFEKEDITEEELIKFYEGKTKSVAENEIHSDDKNININDSMNNLFNEIENFKQNIENNFSENNLVVPNYTNPIEEFNKLNKDFESDIPTLSSEAVNNLSEKRKNLTIEFPNINISFQERQNLSDFKNVVNDLKIENNVNELLRGLIETPYVSGNHFINSIL